MITVIKHGNYVDIAECEKCGCKFSYNKHYDTKVEYEMNGVGAGRDKLYTYINCPECLNKIKIKK